MPKKHRNIDSSFIGLTACSTLIRTALHIPYLQDEKPVGILLVSKPGMGKSLILTRFRSDNIVILNDLTGYGLERTVIELESKGAGYVIVPDILRLMTRKLGWQAFLTLSNILLEEGLSGIRRADADLKFKRPVHFGILTAITVDTLRQNLPYFNAIGFSSRFGMFSYGYERSDSEQVETIISKQAPDDKLVFEINRAKKEKNRVKIAVTTEMSGYIRLLGRRMAYNNGRYMNFRSIGFMRKLAKAHALSCNRKKVTIEDIRAINALLPFFVGSNGDATDLEHFILKGQKVRELMKRYTWGEITKAQERLKAKGLSREMLPENGDR